MQSHTEKVIPTTLIAGDGIAPEIVEATVIVLDALRAPFAWEAHKAGMSGVEAFGDPLPKNTLDSVRRTRLALKGPLTTPVGGGYRSSNVRLREEFHLYANVRPARTLVPGGRYEDIDIVLVRENIEGLYVGFEHYIPIGDDPHAVAIGSGVNTRAGCRRIAEFAFDYALRNGWVGYGPCGQHRRGRLDFRSRAWLCAGSCGKGGCQSARVDAGGRDDA